MTGALSPSHWVIILVVVLLLFGAKRLPDAARGLGKSLRIFKAETAALSEGGDKTSEDGEKARASSEKPAEPVTATEPGPAPVRSAPPAHDTAA